MAKRLLAVLLVLFIAAALFASGSKEAKDIQTVTIWHSAQGSNSEVFEQIAKAEAESES